MPHEQGGLKRRQWMLASRDSLALSLRFGRWGKFITNGWHSTESVVDLGGVSHPFRSLVAWLCNFLRTESDTLSTARWKNMDGAR